MNTLLDTFYKKCQRLNKKKHQEILDTSEHKETNKTTLAETNIADARRPSQKETSLLTIHFQVLC